MKKSTKKGLWIGALAGIALAVATNIWFIADCLDSSVNYPGIYFSFRVFTPGGGVCQPVGPGVDGFGIKTLSEGRRIDISLQQFILTRLVFFIAPLMIIFSIIGALIGRVIKKKDEGLDKPI